MTIPRATARLQFHRGFGFAEAQAQLDYFAALGISHVYASPILTARSGSTHGYDIVDPARINPELGGEDGLRSLVAALHARGMGLIVDIVPNHMGSGAQNPWWQDVLQWGRQSAYAEWFDIDWTPADPALHGKLLLPVLGAPLAQLLHDGEIGLAYDHARQRIDVVCGGGAWPLAPEDYGTVLAGSCPTLSSVAHKFTALRATTDIGQKQALAIQAWQQLDALAAEHSMAEIAAALALFCSAAGVDGMQALLQRQHYRLTHWRNAADEINWRRFFEVSDLVGMRVERADVFEALHGKLFALYQDGLIDGFRIDHIDGLADPAAYATRLRQRLLQLRPATEDGVSPQPYLIAEKILAAEEDLPSAWQLHGTTGYEFMDQAGALLHDERGAAELEAIWRRHSMETEAFADIVSSARRRFLEQNFAAEFNTLMVAVQALMRITMAGADLSDMALRRSMAVLLSLFPVYRSYRTGHACSSADRELLTQAAALASAQVRCADQPALDAIIAMLADVADADAETAALRARIVTRFQQLTPPLAAKSVEDTAFYRYGRLLSRNEVGADPTRLALTPAAFHRSAAQRWRCYPHSLLSTATHDHKRGEDARARLAVLSEIPQRWGQVVHDWYRLNAAAARQHGIDAVDEWMLYQTLIGVWPLQAPDAAALAEITQRLATWQVKALREAKRRTDWVCPDQQYEQACEAFLRQILAHQPGNVFPKAVQTLVDEIAVAGALNSLTQTMLRLTAPGVPDLYQGCELWDFSLVDPDNRRPVDFAARRHLLEQQQSLSPTLADWHTGACKQQLIRAVLLVRQQHADLFAQGRYLPLAVHGLQAAHVIAFARIRSDHAMVVVCSLHAAPLLSTCKTPLVPPRQWGDTALALPPELAGYGQWRCLLSAAHAATGAGHLMVSEVLGHLPVALLTLEKK